MTALEKQRAIAWMHFALAVARRAGALDIEIDHVYKRLKAWGYAVG